MNERELFLAALDIDDPAERQTFLQDACSGDVELLQQVESLLASHEVQSEFLDTPVVEQLTEEPIGDGGATVLMSGATDGDDASDEIPLGYLSPSSREDSQGRLGHYEVLEVVGTGAFGTVLKAFDEKLHRVVAIKVLAPQMASTSPARKRFLREARSSAAVRHDNVVSIYAVEDEPIPYLVMEYIPGETLQQRLDGTGPLELQEVLRLGKQIADGLVAAHAEDLIHRDIKPGNVLLETSVDDHVKITDFGLARTADDASMTQSGMIAGTPLYMAPEQALGQKLDQRADLFSFGSVLYQMVSGRPPFRAPNTVAVLKRVVEDTPRPIQEIIPEVPNWMCDLIGHLHAKDPDQRYGSAREVSEILAQCLADVQESRQPRIPAPATADTVIRPAVSAKARPSVRTSKNSLTRLVAIAVVLLVALGFTEATGVTELAPTVVRLFTGSGTLVIELDDPTATVVINGEEITIRGEGFEELTLRPGEYRVEKIKDGETVKQELVAITRGGRSTVRMILESPSAAAAEEGIDLIALLEPSRDFRDERLKVRDGKLITPQFKRPGAVGVIPYGPVPDEYDIQLRLQRLSNYFAGFNFGIVVGGRQVYVGMDSGFKEKVWGLDFVDGDPAHKPGNPTRNPGRRLIIGQTSDVTIQVRKNHVTTSCDGEVLIDWTGDPELLSVYHELDPHKPDSLFFAAQADFIVHRMTLIPRSSSTPAGEFDWTSEWSADAPPPAIAPFDPRQAKAHQEAWAKYLGVPVEYENSIGMKFRLIPPGEFLMGSTPEEIEVALKVAASNQHFQECINSEAPHHRVVLTQPLFVGVTEVTQARFAQVMETNPSHFTAAGDGYEEVADMETGNHPVENVSWNDAAEFCAKLSQQEQLKPFYFRSGETTTALDGTGYRLPTEAEWESACRAGTTTRFWIGDVDQDLIQAGWYHGNSAGRTHAVGELNSNPFGLLDVNGNVWEWVQDTWEPAFYGKLRENAAIDPSNPFSSDSRQGLRGGSWGRNASYCRSSFRNAHHPSYRDTDIGFRVALPMDAVVESLKVSATATPDNSEGDTPPGTPQS